MFICFVRVGLSVLANSIDVGDSPQLVCQELQTKLDLYKGVAKPLRREESEQYLGHNDDGHRSIFLWRTAVLEDMPEIIELFRAPQTYTLFGLADIDHLIEHADLAAVQTLDTGAVVSFIAVSNYPNIPAVPPSDWFPWICNLYNLRNFTEHNTAFIHLCCWQPEFCFSFLRPLLRSVFLAQAHVTQLILVLPPLVFIPDLFGELFIIAPPTEKTAKLADVNNVQRLAICMRHTIIPRLRLRHAVQEDSDDLTQIFDKCTPEFRNKYGDYYIAELIRDAPPERKFIVAEVDERAAAMMSINAKINLDLLCSHFELGPFFWLHKGTELDHIEKPDSEDDEHSLKDFYDPRVFVMDCEIRGPSSQPQGRPEAESVKHGRADGASSNEGSEDLIVMPDYVANMFDLDDEKEGSESSPDSKEGILRSSRQTIIDFCEAPIQRMLKEIQLKEMGESETSLSNTSLIKDKKKQESDPEMTLFNTSLRMEKKKQKEPSRKDISRERLDPTTELGKSATCNKSKFYGAPNAFSIELFGMREDLDERIAKEILEASFECFPRRDFAVLTMPTSFPVFPLLSHMVRVPPQRNRNFPHDLYVAHRSSVLGDIVVRDAKRTDLRQLRNTLAKAVGVRDILQLVLDSLTYPKRRLQSFVFLVQKEACGVAVVKQDNDVNYATAHYDVEQWVHPRLHRDPEDHVRLLVAALCPIFNAHARFFIKEIHRLSGASCLYYRMTDSKRRKKMHIPTIIGELLPVHPRNVQSISLKSIHPDLRPQPWATHWREDEKPFGLLMSCPRLAAFPRRAVSQRIIVVGASDTGLSFLENLIFGPPSSYMFFLNLTLVSCQGLPDIEAHCPSIEKAMVYRGRYNPHYVQRLQLRTWVSIICGTLSKIDRRKKQIHVEGSDEGNVPFDYLILCSGMQFSRPKPLGWEHLRHSILESHVKETTLRIPCYRERKASTTQESHIENVFTINSVIDADNAFAIMKDVIQHYQRQDEKTRYNKMKNNDGESDDSQGEETSNVKDKLIYAVVVHGHCLEALGCVAALQDVGVPNANIVFVDSFPSLQAVSFFNDPEVSEAVYDQLRQSGVTVCYNCSLINWELDESGRRVEKLVFESRTNVMTIDQCAAFFSYTKKAVHPSMSNAISRSGLVFDGRVVIDNRLRAADSWILAGGTFTKYSRKYSAEHKRHGYFNSAEIGERLAIELLAELDQEYLYLTQNPGNEVEGPSKNTRPGLKSMDREKEKQMGKKEKQMGKKEKQMGKKEMRKHEKMVKSQCSASAIFTRVHSGYKDIVLPHFSRPIIHAACLPGCWCYLNVSSAGPQLPLEYAMTMDDYGEVFVTGDCKSKQGYFRLHVDANHTIATITCYSKKKFDVNNLVKLWGLPISMLNHLPDRFELGEITDLFKYLNAPWTALLYHDRFDWLRVTLHEHLRDVRYSKYKTAYGEILRVMETSLLNPDVDIDAEMRGILKDLRNSQCHELMRAEILRFIYEHREALTMYSHPSLRRHPRFRGEAPVLGRGGNLYAIPGVRK